MTPSMMRFDLIIVIGYFRSALPILSVIRHLSPRISIGICFQPLNANMESKISEAQKKFERLCTESGGVRYEQGSPASCRLLLVQQYLYSDSFVETLRAVIVAEETWGMLSLASMGIDKHDNFIKQFSTTCLTVPDTALAKFLIEARDACSRYQGLEMIEVGLPFQNHPVFEDFVVDWIVVAPTLFSFHSEANKQSFLQNVLTIMEKIPKSDVIAYKSHNGNAKDYFTPRLHSRIAWLIAWIPGVATKLQGLLLNMPSIYKSHISKVLTALLHAQVTKRAVPMTELTQMADMSLEAFLPGVRKGIIGGLSNSIWGSLYFNLPYYNCVDESSRTGKSELINKTSENLLDLNLKYFDLPFCKGNLIVCSGNQNISQIKERSRDLVELIKLHLDKSKN